MNDDLTSMGDEQDLLRTVARLIDRSSFGSESARSLRDRTPHRVAERAVRRIPDNRCLHELFEEQVQRTPKATALIFDDAKVSYVDLNARANQLARYLIRQRVRRGDVVGVYFDRSPLSIAALLAVLKTGSAYTMLDPKWALERLHSEVAISGARVVITIGGRSARLYTTGVDVIRLDSEVVGRIAHEQQDDLSHQGDSADVACVMLDSGMNCVARSHRELVSTYLGQCDLHLGPDEVLLQCSPVTGNAFGLELFGSLLVGGAALLQPGQIPDLDMIVRLVTRHNVTALQLSPNLFNALLDECPGVFRIVQQVLISGEPTSAQLVTKALHEFPQLHLVHEPQTSGW